MKNVYRLIVISILTVLASRSEAQKAPIDTNMLLLPADKKINFNATLQYMSNLTYAGRRDESSVPVLLPGITAVYKHGLFLSASGYFDVNGAKSGSEGLSVTPGYLFSLDTAKKFGGSIMVTKYFITNSSPIILSSFNAMADGQLYYNGPVKFTLGATFSIDKDNNRDLINTVQLEKEIWLYKTGILVTNGLKVTPAVTLYGGSQAFTETYYADSQVPRAIADPALSSPINALFPGLSQQQILNKTVTQEKQREVKQYKLLAISGSVPIDYALNSWQFTITPYLTKPFNQVDYTGSGTTGNYFFFTAAISYIF
jgi:hypothetical protein